MSGKFKKKATGRPVHWIIWILLLAVLTVAAIFIVRQNSQVSDNNAETSSEGQTEIESVEEVVLNLGNGLVITDIGSYTGIFMEDGSDEIVSGVLMIVVKNQGEAPLQYAEINLGAGEESANFSLSTIPVGSSVVVLERDRKEYEKNLEYTAADARNVVWFDSELSLCQDLIQIQPLDGAMNITNVSGKDISENITIYYKNSSPDMLYGGITYRVRLTDGLAAGEVRQIMSDHYSAKSSTVMFVTCG